MKTTDLIPIGQLAARTGVSVSAIRFYEDKGLIRAMRNAGGQRRFLRSDVRRLSFVMIAQQIGFSVAEIADLLADLPQERTPTKADWTKISARFRERLDAQIERLQLTRDRLDGCIGCGCLSLSNCALYNPEDRAARLGPGPRYVMERGAAAKAAEKA
ncbi:redox-sensitive transcriptional activator SoxR [Hyphomonas johnsonii]|uniref:Putative redox-sensitive transcriptional activator SoxR n=1 Tax=Hyphomonas johnsonii MHS-2 TaxID=1280950 RepID=A0A059FP84_9PROT|nr:redox-sensitive transcriptional activator SoxR [Hyphomonas johnsonii]KCZ92427.1 putative redox-sensitive transcriptional activator SoxR [Hyphomonas johnsonii MHS-2]